MLILLVLVSLPLLRRLFRQRAPVSRNAHPSATPVREAHPDWEQDIPWATNMYEEEA